MFGVIGLCLGLPLLAPGIKIVRIGYAAIAASRIITFSILLISVNARAFALSSSLSIMLISSSHEICRQYPSVCTDMTPALILILYPVRFYGVCHRHLARVQYNFLILIVSWVFGTCPDSPFRLVPFFSARARKTRARDN